MNPPIGLVKIIVDRPMGSFHPEHSDLFYPINYGYIPGMIARTVTNRTSTYSESIIL